MLRCFEDLASALAPQRCPGCGGRGDPLCPECLGALTPPPPAAPPAGIERWSAAYADTGAAREIIARVKYRNARAALPWIATATHAAAVVLGPSDVVTWVPTTARRRRARGFDHAELLARRVAQMAGHRAVATLDRLDDCAQTDRVGAVRRGGPRLSVRGPAGIAGWRILVVDDVATTGASLSSAAGALRVAGAREVVAATFARTPLRPAGPA